MRDFLQPHFLQCRCMGRVCDYLVKCDLETTLYYFLSTWENFTFECGASFYLELLHHSVNIRETNVFFPIYKITDFTCVDKSIPDNFPREGFSMCL